MCSLVSNIYITLNNATQYPSGYQIIVVIPICDYLNRGNSFKDHIQSAMIRDYGYEYHNHFQQYFRNIVAVSLMGLYCCFEYTSPRTGFNFTTYVAIGTDSTETCRSNYHTITTTSRILLQRYLSKIQHLSTATNKLFSGVYWCLSPL